MGTYTYRYLADGLYVQIYVSSDQLCPKKVSASVNNISLPWVGLYISKTTYL